MINLKEVSNVGLAIAEYNELAYSFCQLDPKQTESLKELWNRISKNPWLDSSELEMWQMINLHIVSQSWSNTSGGYGGMGGAAITVTYTTIIENNYLGFACIFYGHDLIYVCDIDDKYHSCKYESLPGLSTCKSKLKTFYVKRMR